MAAVLLDTTVAIELLRGRDDAIARLRALREAGDRGYVVAITVEEAVRGLRPGSMKGRGSSSSSAGVERMQP